ncbi:MAG: ABATE domain-containing protein [Candidatus Neomarinimicrobiota bacterium]
MTETNAYNLPLKLETGWICLDFANTAEWHASDHPDEHIGTYRKLVSWARDVGVLENQEAEKILQESRQRPVRTKRVHRQAISLRETIYQIFSAVAEDRQPESSNLAALNASLSEALVHLRLLQSEKGFDWGWSGDENALDRILWPIARSAASLLTSDAIERVGECADDRGCGWLFFDMSRNRSRRWCDMKDCGNRNKVRRYYARKRK